MNDALALIVAGLAGCLLGVFFFGGLWWTVRKGLASSRPAAWFLVSLLVRMGVVLGGFYLAAGGDWTRLLACLSGFILARCGVAHGLRPVHERHTTAEIRHAP